MQKVNKSPGSLISGILIPLFFLFLLTSCRQEISPISEENIIALQLWLDENQTSPGELISEELNQGRSLILTQDNHLRADTIDLVKTLVPGLYDQGVREIGLFFLDTDKQRELDELVIEGNEKTLAEKLLFSADAAMGYIEYCDFIIYIRDFNLTLDENETAIRLLALGKNGKVSTDLLSEALENPEQDNSDNVELKLPVFLWISSEDVELLPSYQENKAQEESEAAKKPVILTHHGPGNKYYRWNGLIEAVSAQRDIRDRTYAFHTADPPFPGWNNDEAGVSADIYIVTPYAYRAVQAIPDFVSSETASRALDFYPDIKMKKPPGWAAFRMNRITRKKAAQYNREIEKLLLPGNAE